MAYFFEDIIEEFIWHLEHCIDYYINFKDLREYFNIDLVKNICFKNSKTNIYDKIENYYRKPKTDEEFNKLLIKCIYNFIEYSKIYYNYKNDDINIIYKDLNQIIIDLCLNAERKNRCCECNCDIGFYNSRQLCRKTFCENIELIN